MVHMIGQAVGVYTDETHGMTLSAVSMAYYRFILPYGLQQFKRFAINVWDVDVAGKSDKEIAAEGLDRMESYMKEIGVVMHITEFGVTEEMISDISKNVFVLNGGYKKLSVENVVQILADSM